MPNYANLLLSDLPEQFKEKAKIEDLIIVIGLELQTVYDFFMQLRDERGISTAVGAQLDGIGDIVALTRDEAMALAEYKQRTDLTDDELYRRYLYYKVIQNNFECTYSDLIKSIEMFWGGPTISYSEDPEHPAKIQLDFDTSGDWSQKILSIPIAKAGGVGLGITAKTEAEFPIVYGFGLHFFNKYTVGCAVPVLERVPYLADELDLILVDELGAWLTE